MSEASPQIGTGVRRRNRRGDVLFASLCALGFAVLLLVSAWLVLPACGALPFFGRLFPSFCPAVSLASVRDGLAAEQSRHDALVDEIRRLELAILGLDQCEPVQQATALPQSEPAPPLPVEPVEPVEPADPAEAIDEERWEQRDVSLLEGCWNLDSDYKLRDIDTDEIVTVDEWQVCFDEGGVGRQELRLSSGATCEGPINGGFSESGALRLEDQENVRCSGGLEIFQREITCENSGDGSAECEGVQESTGSRSRMRLTR